jgi:Fe-S cluster assembly protein SufD
MQSRALMNRSKAIMRGLIYIHEAAEDSNGYQRNEVMMLDNESRAVSIPDLEIHNDNVRCTHGSSVSRPDAEEIFYIQSRGLNEIQSQRLIIQGFYEKIIQYIPEHLKDAMRKKIERILYLES